MTARNALERMRQGGTRLLREALWPGEWREAMARWIILGLLGSITVTAVALYPWVLYAAAGVCAAIAYAAGQPEEEDLDEDEEPEEFEEEPLHPADVTDLVRDVVAGRNGALLTELRDAVEEEQPGRSWTTRDVRALLAEAGIPVRDGVRVRGAGNGPGVHHKDVPAPLSPTPSETPVGVVGAGHDANTNTNNLRVTRTAEGVQITIQDLAAHHHTEVPRTTSPSK